MTTALGKVPLCVSTVVHYKLRIATVLACLCVQILSTFPSGVSLRVVTSECTALLSWKSGFGGVSDGGFSSCTVPTYYCGSKYFYNQCPHVQNLIGTECSLNRSECRVKSKAS